MRRIVRIANVQRVEYTKLTRKQSEREAMDVTQFVKKIQNVDVSPKHLRELGLPSDWKKRISPRFVEKVVKTAERYKRDLKELSKR
jgi:cytidylate kinase